jgi:hypothetical protein
MACGALIITMFTALSGWAAAPAQIDSSTTVCEYRHVVSRGIVHVYRVLRVDATGRVLWLGRLPMRARGPDSARIAAEAQPVEIHRVGRDQLEQATALMSKAEQGELQFQQKRLSFSSTVYQCFRPAAQGKSSRAIVLKEVTDTSRTENTAPAARALVQWLDSLRTFAPRTTR